MVDTWAWPNARFSAVSIARGVMPRREAVAPVDHERHLQPAVLLVGADVGELRDVAQRRLELRRPRAQLVQVVAAQRELLVRFRLAPPAAQVLDRVEEEVRARLPGERRTQPREDLVEGFLALLERLQRDEHHGRVALASRR